jgi:CMP-N,N'-diacetyllegionaminic acid synthase
MNILITICARGGSKGIPGKNLKPIAGKALIFYTLDVAKRISENYTCKIALSTDDFAIKKTVENFGVVTNYIRPDFLATDFAGKIETIKDLLLYEESLINHKYDFVLDLDVTSPLRTLEDLEKSFNLIRSNPDALNLFSVNSSARNPYFNMVEENDKGFYSLVKMNSCGSIKTRQSAPKVYDMNASFYWYRRPFFDLGINTSISNKSIIYEMNHICFDLDRPIDFIFMEFLLQNNLLDFKL